MIKDLRNTFKQTAIYGISNVLVKATGLVLLPIYTSSLTIADYGMLVLIEIITQFFVDVISVSLPSAMLRLGSDTTDKKRQNEFYSTAIFMLLGIGILFLTIFLPLSGLFSQAFFDSGAYAGYFVIVFISVILEILGLMPMQLLRLREQSGKYVFFFGLKLAALIGFIWYFVSVKEMGVYGAIIGALLANITLLLATSVYQFKNLVLKFDREAAREMFHFGSPLIFTSIAAILITISDRIIINIYGQLADVGIYTLAYKVGSVSNLLVIGSFALGFLPIVFKKFGEPNFNRFFSKMLTYFIGITILLTLVISLFSNEIIKLISSDNPDYWVAVILVPFIAYMFLFKALQSYLSYVFLFIKRTKFNARVTVFGVLINIGLNFILIPIIGIYGAITATAFSYISMGLYTYYLAQKHYKIVYEYKRIVLLMVGCALFIAIGIYFNNLQLLYRTIIKTGLIIGFGIWVFYAIADETERDKTRKIWLLIKSGKLKAILAQWTSS